MPNVNQASLREEFATLKGQFEQLSAAGKVSEELRTLVQALLLLLELLMAVFMEKHTPKSSRNSGLPPSQTGKDAQTTSQPGSRAKGCGNCQGTCRLYRRFTRPVWPACSRVSAPG